jgi:hypothetical protein
MDTEKKKKNNDGLLIHKEKKFRPGPTRPSRPGTPKSPIRALRPTRIHAPHMKPPRGRWIYTPPPGGSCRRMDLG